MTIAFDRVESVIGDPEELSQWGDGDKTPGRSGFWREWALRIWRTRERTTILRPFILKEGKRYEWEQEVDTGTWGRDIKRYFCADGNDLVEKREVGKE